MSLHGNPNNRMGGQTVSAPMDSPYAEAPAVAVVRALLECAAEIRGKRAATPIEGTPNG